ncbi:MAG: hypothetical protein M3Y66_06240 [Actinomycetota bacterium]|nr:hypothetical protein [Actinomycetota bacterium]
MSLRVLALFAVAVLVNLPVANDAWLGHRLDRDGITVAAAVVGTRTISGRHFVDYRLPGSAGGSPRTYSARVDDPSYQTALSTQTLPVRFLPGDPGSNRPLGRVGGAIFYVAALLGDTVLLVLVLLLLGRSRRWRMDVVGVDGDLVRLTLGGEELVAAADDAERLRPGQRLRHRLLLAATGDVAAGLPLGELEHVAGASYVARGRVEDVRRGRLRLRLSNGYGLPVEVGPHRNRADYRDHAEVTGTLVLRRR